MSVNNDAVTMRNDERYELFSQFREMYGRMDELIIALYRSALYTVREYDHMAAEYRMLKTKADNLEEYIRTTFPAKDLNKTLNWLKSNPKDENYPEEDPEEWM